MDRETWQATVHGGPQESDITEQLTLLLIIIMSINIVGKNC